VIVGVLYIIGTVAGVLSVIATGHVLKEPGVLDNVGAHEDQLVAGALLVLAMGLALAMVPVMMFPILKRQSETGRRLRTSRVLTLQPPL
jgi:hypothetical protein